VKISGWRLLWVIVRHWGELPISLRCFLLYCVGLVLLACWAGLGVH